MIPGLILLLTLLTGVQIPPGSVSGRVVDAVDGRPLSGINVHLFRKTYDEFGVQRITAIGFTATNEKGEYRFSDVLPSRPFYIGISSVAHGESYFPATRDISAASPLETLPGHELGGIDFKAAPTRVFKIRGRMLDALHVRQPHLSSVILVRRYIENFSRVAGSRVAEDGSFELPDVPPGSYYLLGNRIDDEPNRSQSVLPVDVDDHDIEDIDLIAAEGYEVNGRVRVEGLPIKSLRVVLKPVNDPASLIAMPPAVHPNGTFVIPNLHSGEHRLSIAGIPSDYYIKSASFGAVDVLSNGISLRGAVSGFLDVVVSNNGGRLQGTVVDPAGKLPAHSVVVMVPESPRPERSDLYKVTLTDANGRFTITGIAPGSYDVLTTDEPAAETYRDPAFIARFTDRSRRLSFAAGELVTVELRTGR